MNKLSEILNKIHGLIKTSDDNYIEAYAGSVTPGSDTSDYVMNGPSITLTPGLWLVDMYAEFPSASGARVISAYMRADGITLMLDQHNAAANFARININKIISVDTTKTIQTGLRQNISAGSSTGKIGIAATKIKYV